jgi:hypothetical protein
MEGNPEAMCTSEQVGSERLVLVSDDIISQHSGCGGRADTEISRSARILAHFDFTENKMASLSVRNSYLLQVYNLEQGSIKT